jgi:Protein of unknown function (DUF2845)
MKSFTSLLLAAGMVLAACAPLLAGETETCLCRNGIVSRGDIIAEVLKKCGPPAQRYQREETRAEKRAISIVAVDEWVYNFGPNEFMYSIRFENGRVARIESLEYGY